MSFKCDRWLISFAFNVIGRHWIACGLGLLGFHLGFVLLRDCKMMAVLLLRIDALLIEETRIGDDRPLWWEDDVILARLMRHGRAEFLRPAVMTSTTIITITTTKKAEVEFEFLRESINRSNTILLWITMFLRKFVGRKMIVTFKFCSNFFVGSNSTPIWMAWMTMLLWSYGGWLCDEISLVTSPAAHTLHGQTSRSQHSLWIAVNVFNTISIFHSLHAFID